MKSIIAIFVGAGLGALLRWWLGLTLNSYFPSIPPGTVAANLIGGLTTFSTRSITQRMRRRTVAAYRYGF